MNRREFLKAMLMMAGAHLLGVARSNPSTLGLATLTVTDPQGRIRWVSRPVQMIGGCGGMFYTKKLLDANPLWKSRSLPSLYFVNRRLEQPLARLFAERWV